MLLFLTFSLGALFNLLLNFLHGSISNPRSSFKGTPQGFVLSPTLFNLYLSKINETLHPATELLQFVDDIVIFSSDKDTTSAIQSVERSLQSLNTFLLGRGLEISLSKTQLMVFSLKRPLNPPNYHISIQNHRIPASSSVRFLGVLLDPRLSGRLHMTSIIQKGKRIMQVISALRGTWWGAYPHVLLIIYRAMLRAIEYSAHIFGLMNNDLSRAFQIIQNQALRLCYGYRIFTPLNVIYAETVELTLSSRFRLLTSKYFMKISSVRDHPAVVKLHELYDLALNTNRINYLRAHFPAVLIFPPYMVFPQRRGLLVYSP